MGERRARPRQQNEGSTAAGWRYFLPRIALSFASLILTLGLVEVSMRTVAWVTARRELAQSLDEMREPPAGEPVKLGHVIQRSTNPRLIYELRPNLDCDFRYEGARLTTNVKGLRGNPTTGSKGPTEVRIVGLGDSVMFGWGVSDHETYLSLLEQRLAREHPQNRWSIVNLSVPGYNTTMEVEALVDHGLELQPDLVLIELVGNDLGLPTFITASGSPWRFDRLMVAELVSRARRSELASEPEEHGLFKAPFDDEENEHVPDHLRYMVGWEAYERALCRLGDLAAQHSFRAAVISRKPSRNSPLRRRAFEIAEQCGLETLDSGGPTARYLRHGGIRNLRGSVLTMSERDPHPSVLGHQLLAEGLYEALEEAGLFQDSRPR